MTTFYQKYPFFEIFDLSYNHYALLHLIPTILNIYLFWIVNRQRTKSVIHYYLILMIISSSFWGIQETFVRLANTAVAASFWDLFQLLGWVFLVPSTLGFVIAYTNKRHLIYNFLFHVLLFGPAFFFLFLGLTTDLVFPHIPALYTRDSFYNWSTTTNSLYDYVIVPWIVISISIAIFLTLRYWTNLKDKIKRKQATIILLSTSLPFIGTFFTDLMIPVLKIPSSIQIGVVLSTVSILVMTYGISKYKLLVINPATVVSNIVGVMHEILIVFNGIDHKIEYINDPIEKILGYKREELEGQPVSKILSSDLVSFHQKVLLPVEEGKEVSSLEIDLVSKDGKKVPVSFSASPYKGSDGTLLSIVGVATDIRQLKELLNVAAEQSKLKVTIESISDGVLALDLEGRIIMLNTSACNLLGLGKDEVIGARLDQLVKLENEAEDLLSLDNLLPQKEIKEEIEILYKKELTITTKNEQRRAVNLTSSTIKEGSKVGLGAIITLQDLEKERQLEEMKLDFVSMAAHELRTPLTSLRGYTYILLRDYKEKLDDKASMILGRISISTQRLVGLVENLLNVTRIEKGTLTINLETIDWGENVLSVIEEIKDQAKDKNIDISFDKAHLSLIPQVKVDKLRINEVLTNLLANAINYTQPNGEITLWIEQTPKEVITHIKDTGEGIPQEALSHLFTKFFRVQGKLEQGSKGTGLGLYISKSIVEMHHGRIWAESQGLGKGSTFSFSLPLEEQLIASVTNK